MSQRLTRLPNWEERFYNRLEEYRGKSFEWGKHDCATCAADLIERLTGENLMAGIAAYTDLKSSLKAIKKAGYDSLEAVVDSKLDPIDNLYQAGRGDLIMCEVDGKQFLAVKTGSVAVAPGKTGPMHIDMKYWIKAWRV